MSGFVVVINQNGAPASPQLLRKMTDSMIFRGPDAQEIWTDGNIGMGHAMLRTTFESELERQPFSLDGRRWIAADARVDGRADLIRRLAIQDPRLKNAPDNELILHAYQKWGEDCVQYLIGDFAFAIWDSRDRRLFCARDHFGVKPFYYAQVGDCLLISNTLDCVRLHPAVSDSLNEQAIGDFLLVGSNEEPDTTFFADIKRLPAAHTLSWENRELKARRYWTLPILDEIRYKHESDYIEHFVELLDSAVADRLRTDRVGMFMSGGMDSATIAATAQKVLSQKHESFDLRAFTVVYDRLIPDEERYYSGLVAESLRIPIQYFAADDCRLFEWQGRRDSFTPEPVHEPLAIISQDQFAQMSARARVALTGQGGDAILRPSFSYLLNLFKGLRLARALREVGTHYLAHRQLPRIGFRTWWRRRKQNLPSDYGYPVWLNRDFEKRLKLLERWRQLNAEPSYVHPRRPEAYMYLTALFWANLFENYDPSYVGFPIETRHPLFDLRLVEYSLRLPSLPWCVDKQTMRVAMRERLPESVRSRRKAPLAGDPVVELSRRAEHTRLDDFDSSPILGDYVRRNSIPKVSECLQAPDQLWINLQPLSLNYWLHSLSAFKLGCAALKEA
jgi:asparagine synthase (glutamine-hydrolysing)